MTTTVPSFPMCTITTADGTVVVPCEPLGGGLAITPVFGMTEDFRAALGGDFVLTHVETGLTLSDGPGCIECCRSAGKALLATGVDWSTLTSENVRELSATWSDEVRAQVAEARTVSWSCDAEDCDPWPEESVAERSASRSAHLKKIAETNARLLAKDAD